MRSIWPDHTVLNWQSGLGADFLAGASRNGPHLYNRRFRDICMRTEIKICGLSTPEAVKAAVDAGANLIGFIFFEKSPRNVTLEKAADLSRQVAKTVAKVAVTVGAPQAVLDAIVKQVHPDFLQLHGSETPQQVAEIKERYGLPVIKAFAIRTEDDFGNLAAYEGIADRFLLDAKAPAGSDLPGGNGVSFDWHLLDKLRTATPVMLSGGLDSANILAALEVSKLHSIDVSSGVESTPGIKDIAKINAFIKTVREHDKVSGFDKPTQKANSAV